MVNNLVFRWPKSLFFYGFGGSWYMYIYIYQHLEFVAMRYACIANIISIAHFLRWQHCLQTFFRGFVGSILHLFVNISSIICWLLTLQNMGIGKQLSIPHLQLETNMSFIYNHIYLYLTIEIKIDLLTYLLIPSIALMLVSPTSGRFYQATWENKHATNAVLPGLSHFWQVQLVLKTSVLLGKT